MKKYNLNTQSLTSYAVYIAFFLIFGLVPYLGYISIPPIKATMMAIPAGALIVHKGWKGAIVAGFMFGITSIIAAVLYGSAILSNYGWGKTLVILFVGRLAIIPPIIIILALYDLIVPKSSNKALYSVKVATITLFVAIFNALIVIGILVAYNGSEYGTFIILVGKNIAIEWTIGPFVAFFLGPAIRHIILRESQIKSAVW